MSHDSREVKASMVPIEEPFLVQLSFLDTTKFFNRIAGDYKYVVFLI